MSCENNVFVQNRSTNIRNLETWQKRELVLQNTPQWMLLQQKNKASFKLFGLSKVNVYRQQKMTQQVVLGNLPKSYLRNNRFVK